jgi:hypothetical protein
MLVSVRTQADVQQLHYGLNHCGIRAPFAARVRECSRLRLIYVTHRSGPLHQPMQMVLVVSSRGTANEA